jgi:hypothetical protein
LSSAIAPFQGAENADKYFGNFLCETLAGGFDLRIMRVLGSGRAPRKPGDGDIAMSVPRDKHRAFLRSIASAELFNKKIKTDVWALFVGIGIRLFRH